MPKTPERPLPKVAELFDTAPLTGYLERREDGLYLVSKEGHLAAIQVQDEETEGWTTFWENAAKMTKAAEINNAVLQVRRYPWMTEPAKRARVNLLRARWRELFGDAMFVVDD